MTKKPEGSQSGLAQLSETLQALIDVAERVVRADKRGATLPRGLAKAAKKALRKADL